MLRDALARTGLTLHPMAVPTTNVDTWQFRGKVLVKALVPDKPLILLGAAVWLSDISGVPLANRIAIAWRMFWQMNTLLLHNNASSLLNSRLRLFDAMVGCCALWCAGCWTLRRREEEHLQVAQRSMLSRIVNVARYPEEEWVEWITRPAANVSMVAAVAANIWEWVSAHCERKWR